MHWEVLARRLAHLEEQVQALARMEFVPPLRHDDVAGVGRVVSIDEQLLTPTASGTPEVPIYDQFDAVVKIVDGTRWDAALNTYDVLVQLLDEGLEWADATPAWIIDLAGSAALTAGQRYPALIARDEAGNHVLAPGGPYYVNLLEVNGPGNPLGDTTKWLMVSGSITPDAWEADTFEAGTLKSNGGSDYIALVETSEEPGMSSDWLLVTLADAGAYREDAYYEGAGVYVQEVRLLYVVRSSREPFVARVTAVGLHFGKWVYAFTEQTISPDTGEYVAAASPRTGDTHVGPFLYELNNHYVETPSLVLVWMRGVFGGVAVYEFDRCCEVCPIPFAHSTDAFLVLRGGTSHSTNAYLVIRGLPEHATDAYLVFKRTKLHTTDLYKVYRRTRPHWTNSWLVRRGGKSHGTNAFLLPDGLWHATDAMIGNYKQMEFSTDAYAVLQLRRGHSTNCFLLPDGLWHATDSYLVMQWANPTQHYSDCFLAPAGLWHATDCELLFVPWHGTDCYLSGGGGGGNGGSTCETAELLVSGQEYITTNNPGETRYYYIPLSTGNGYSVSFSLEGASSFAAYGGNCASSNLEASSSLSGSPILVSGGAHTGPYVIVWVTGDGAASTTNVWSLTLD